MASAIKMTKKVAVPVPPVITQYRDADDGVSLRLTQAEALTLAAVLGRVGGAPDTTARGYATQISNALYDAGIRYPHDYLGSGLTHAVYFGSGTKARIAELAGEQKKDPYAGIAGAQIEAAYAQAAVTQKQDRVVGMHPALGAGYGGSGSGFNAGAAIQGCLDKIPETIVNAKYKY